jgi:hypothetical protein
MSKMHDVLPPKPRFVFRSFFVQMGNFNEIWSKFIVAAAEVKGVWTWNPSALFSVRQELGSMCLGHCW